jgi:LPXTG-motif cell wall-anchored protein
VVATGDTGLIAPTVTAAPKDDSNHTGAIAGVVIGAVIVAGGGILMARRRAAPPRG